MKILVYVHDLGVGGSQLNAIELAGALAREGHELAIFGQPGPLMDTIEKLGLEFLPAPTLGRRPSRHAIRELVRIAGARRLDILHGYEWPPAMECYLAARHLTSTVAVSTVMSMRVAPFLPKNLPLSVGTELIAETEKTFGRTAVSLLEPPVDTETNRPGLSLGQMEFRRKWGVEDDTYVVAVVSRLAHQLKLEGILAAMQAVASLSTNLKVSLLIAGDGPARVEVSQHAREINRQTGRQTVILTGELSDPRPVYDLADVCLGMGGSALRAMAFAKPLIVQGENGFWELLTPAALSTFLWQGWYGVGDDPMAGRRKLTQLLQDLLLDKRLRKDLGDFGLGVVRDRFSLSRAAEIQVSNYSHALGATGQQRDSLLGNFAAAGRFLSYESRRVASRLAGREASDDFNAVPLVAPARAAWKPRVEPS